MVLDQASLADRLAVYLVADPAQTNRSIIDDVERALAGGVTAVQLRAKQLSDLESFKLGNRLKEMCAKFSALFLVNDRMDIALATGADGVHLGVDDLPVPAARSIAPSGFVIGYSPSTDEEAARAALLGADYLGIGPVFGTQSKDDAGAPIGLNTLHRRVRVAGIPVIGIGGINADNVASVIDAGAVGAAVISAILRAEDPEVAARLIAEEVQTARSNGRRSA
jgi:thiamine-phosphate pyrophosphorylase